MINAGFVEEIAITEVHYLIDIPNERFSFESKKSKLNIKPTVVLTESLKCIVQKDSGRSYLQKDIQVKIP